MIALVVADTTNPSYMTVTCGVEDVASDRDHLVLLRKTDEPEKGTALPQDFFAEKSRWNFTRMKNKTSILVALVATVSVSAQPSAQAPPSVPLENAIIRVARYIPEGAEFTLDQKRSKDGLLTVSAHSIRLRNEKSIDARFTVKIHRKGKMTFTSSRAGRLTSIDSDLQRSFAKAVYTLRSRRIMVLPCHVARFQNDWGHYFMFWGKPGFSTTFVRVYKNGEVKVTFSVD